MKSKKLKSLKLVSGRYRLSRESDGVGDEGSSVLSIDFSKDTIKYHRNEIRVGCRLQVGSIYARTMRAQDWWMTSDVTEILEVVTVGSTQAGHYPIKQVTFKTRNSVYVLEAT